MLLYAQNHAAQHTGQGSQFSNQNQNLQQQQQQQQQQQVPQQLQQQQVLQQLQQQQVPQQLQQLEQTEQFSVLVRNGQSGQNQQKEVKISLYTYGQYMEIDMLPPEQSQQGHPQVLVNQQKQQISSEQSNDHLNGAIQIYGLPNNEVKVDVANEFFVHYDGQRVRLTVINENRFRGNVRGLCGTFTNNKNTDFTGPENCIYGNAEQFVRSYKLNNNQQQQQQLLQQNQNQQTKGGECIYKEIIYANVISNRDAGRHSSKPGGHHLPNMKSCTKHQTRYVVQSSGKVCFTIRPMPICKSGCKATSHILKSVGVHCLQKTKTTELWMKQIDKGASPDFGMKQVTTNIKVKVPHSCIP